MVIVETETGFSLVTDVLTDFTCVFILRQSRRTAGTVHERVDTWTLKQCVTYSITYCSC